VRRRRLDVNPEDRDLLLAGLFELSIVRLENDDLVTRVRDLAERLGGDVESLYYGGSLE
jgi:hypothetical protein